MIFTEKEKEPILSPKMISILNKSELGGGDKQYDDIFSYKYKIMKILSKNPDILRALHNKELEEKIVDWNNPNGDIYRNVCIFDFLKIPGVQSQVKNFICFEVNDTQPMLYNEDILVRNILFRTISHEDDYKTDWGINRQDLLAAIIKSEFDWTNVFGSQLEKVLDKGKITDNGYYYREFAYRVHIPNNLVNKASNGGFSYGK